MLDSYGRNIDYMRLSVTEFCNFRCTYCVSNVEKRISYEDMLSYEELLRIAKIGVNLGITKYKITGGEPFVRNGILEFIKALKELDGVQQVTVTTNGSLLSNYLTDLHNVGVDGINVSLDSMDNNIFCGITGQKVYNAKDVIYSILQSAKLGIYTKVNSLLLKETTDIVEIARLAEKNSIDVRFIEVMPIGKGISRMGISSSEALSVLYEEWNDLHEISIKRGNGPARYFESSRLKGKIGFIDAISTNFCDNCNRIRVTSRGVLKTCLSYCGEVDLKELMRNGIEDEELQRIFKQAIIEKPKQHSFTFLDGITENNMMYQIGG